MVENPQAMAPYKRIAAQIIERIERGELRPGDRVPSVREIMKSEGVSSATASKVPPFLRAEGYVVSTPGHGTTVIQRRKLTPGADRFQMLRAGGDGLKPGERVEIIDAGLAEAPQHAADALGIEEGAQAIRRRRRYLDDSGVATLSTSWLPSTFADPAPELLRAESLPKMTLGLVEERTGRKAVRQRDTERVGEVPDDLAPLLGCDPGTPVLVVINHYWDHHGEIIEYAVDYHGPGRERSSEYDLD